MKKIKHTLNKIENIIEQIELDYIEFVCGSLEDRKKSLPLTDKKQIKGLIWNLLTSQKYRKLISGVDFNKILEIFFNRISNNNSSYKFFQNKNCKYFPCHNMKNIEDFNCLFCYCPLYFFNDCGGNYKSTNNLKDCSDCVFPHEKDNYDKITNHLK